MKSDIYDELLIQGPPTTDQCLKRWVLNKMSQGKSVKVKSDLKVD